MTKISAKFGDKWDELGYLGKFTNDLFRGLRRDYNGIAPPEPAVDCGISLASAKFLVL